MNKIYILGHKGFIGQRVAERLPIGHLVFLSREDFTKICNNESIISFHANDRLINLAWDHLDNFNSVSHLSEVLPAHIQFYENAFKMGLKNVTAIGTCVEYGKVEGELDEALVTSPVLPYAIAKDALRKYLEFKKTKLDFSFNWIRLFYIYGEGQPERTIYQQLLLAIKAKKETFDMSPGQQKRDYLHVNHVSEIIAKVALGEQSYGIINCCSGEPIKMVDFIQQRLTELGQSLELNLGKYPYPTYEAFEFWGSTKKLQRFNLI